jgi:hypothetical protein
VRNLETAQTHSFSIHQVAERKQVAFGQIETQYDSLEREMLDEFSNHLKSFQGTSYLHWNMRDINYGFAAIEHRHKVLEGEPYILPDERKIDLSRLLIDIYGGLHRSPSS